MRFKVEEVFGNWKFWIALLLLYPPLLLLTAWKDLVYTGDEPNLLFYATVPEVGILSSSLFIYLLMQVFRKPLVFLEILKIVFITEFIFQLWENLAKIVYYEIWKYPGILWFLVFPFSLALVSWLFRRICGTGWPLGILLAVVAFVSGTVFGVLFSSLSGITTPGS